MQSKITKCLGLVTQYNPLKVQPGALRRAYDCFIRREDVVEDRRGYLDYVTLGSNIAQFMVYDNLIIAHRGTTLSYDNGAGSFNDYSGTYTAISGEKLRYQEAFSNLYVTTAEGVKVFSDVAGTAGVLAGVPRSLDPAYSLTSISSGFLSNGNQCAYRSLLVRTDANNNVIRGYPSQRLWVTNASGNDENVTLTNFLPSEALAGDVIEFYRTEQISGTSTDGSGDECGLVYQYELTATDISNGYVTFTDSVTDTLIGAIIYTAPSQEGIRQANDRPPVAKDVALYKSNFMFYANTETKQRLFSTLVGTHGLGFATTGDTNTSTSLTNVADTDDLQVGWKVEGTDIPANTTIAGIAGSTITLSQAATGTTAGASIQFFTDETLTVGGISYQFGSSEDHTTPQVQVGVTGTAAADIDNTARSLIRVINKHSSNTAIYAYYLTGPDDLPGQIMYEEQGLGASAFTAQVSDDDMSDMFFPAIPVDPATTSKCTSSNDQRKNAVYYSKNQQLEHVPALNFLPVGPANKEILRIVALRDSAIVIKEEGVYRITGEDPQSFTVVPVDLTVFCKAKESVAVLSNQVFMLSNQGVVSISESDVQVISRDIEPEINPLLAVSSLSNYTYGVGYESERSYFLSTITDTTDTAPNRTLVYNIFTKTWVIHRYGFEAAVVEDGVDKLFYVGDSSAIIKQERKDFTDDDYADAESSITISDITGDIVTFTSTVVPQIGDAIKQGDTAINIETLTILSGAYQATMDSTPPAAWAAGAANLFPGVGMDVEWHSWTGEGNHDILKQVQGVGFFTDDIPGQNTVTSIVAKFSSNFDPETEEVTITPPEIGGWGSAWGSFGWGGGDSHGYPTWVPMNKQYSTRLTVGVEHKNALQKLSLTGVGFTYRGVSDRVGR